jgi:hypothetical protein
MVVGHDGVIPGFGSRFFFLPDVHFGGVIAANSSEAGPVASILVRELIDEVIGVPQEERSGELNKGKKPQGSGKGVKAKIGKEKGKAEAKMQQRQTVHRPRAKSAPPQETPLEAYIGKYWQPGYRTLAVEIKGNKLFVDATDRSMGFTLAFEHISDQTKYIAHLSDHLEGGDDPIQAEFVFESGRAVKMGLQLEMSLKDMIWFERVEESR